MATKPLLRPYCHLSTPSTPTLTQIRHASLLRRPIRPYTFTQLVTLSDGSTYLTRTTSPLPIFRSTKDTRNSPLWQPSLAALRNQEQDEAGRLRAFRERFGRGWDAEAVGDEGEEGGEEVVEGKRESKEKRVEEAQNSLMDLISGGYTEQTTAEERADRREAREAIESVLVKMEEGKKEGKKAPKKK